MIPVALYGLDVAKCERFYDEMPQLVSNAYEDRSYIESLYSVPQSAQSNTYEWLMNGLRETHMHGQKM